MELKTKCVNGRSLSKSTFIRVNYNHKLIGISKPVHNICDRNMYDKCVLCKTRPVSSNSRTICSKCYVIRYFNQHEYDYSDFIIVRYI